MVVGTVAFDEQATVVGELMTVAGVVSVRELLSNSENVSIELVQHTRAALEESLRELDQLGVEIDRVEILKRERTKPYNNFGEKFTEGEETE